jgi:two-component system nitrogen regulation response regulator GlnG
METSERRNQIEIKRLFLEQVVKEFGDSFITDNDRKLYKLILGALERPLIESVLEKTEGNQLKAARILGINRNTLHSKIKKLGIEVSRWKKY